MCKIHKSNKRKQQSSKFFILIFKNLNVVKKNTQIKQIQHFIMLNYATYSENLSNASNNIH
jgi:hypothetical protein